MKIKLIDDFKGLVKGAIFDVVQETTDWYYIFNKALIEPRLIPKHVGVIIEDEERNKVEYNLIRTCPKCKERENILTERRPNGMSRCNSCQFKDKTSYFDSYELKPLNKDKELVLNTITDYVKNLGYYDRETTRKIEELLASEVITVEEMAMHFKEQLLKGLKK